MILTFLDSSALLRVCFREGDRELVEAALLGRGAASRVTTVEVPAAIHARFHRGSLDDSARDEYLRIGAELLANLTLVEVNDAVVESAVRLAANALLRSLDAIQIASAAVARSTLGGSAIVRFCTADRRQAAAASQLLGAEHVDLLPAL